MVDLHSFRNRTDDVLVGVPMGHPSLSADVEEAVAPFFSIARADPYPTPCVGFEVNELPEPFSKRLHRFQSTNASVR
jgi:hypothetical protein